MGTTLSAEPFQTEKTSTVWPGPVMHIAMGGLVCAIVAAPLITNPYDVYAPPNAFGYLVVLLGLPLGGLVYRFRSRKLPIDLNAKRKSRLAIGVSFLIPLCMAILVGLGSGYKTNVFMGIGAVMAMSSALAMLCCGNRRPRTTP